MSKYIALTTNLLALIFIIILILIPKINDTLVVSKLSAILTQTPPLPLESPTRHKGGLGGRGIPLKELPVALC